MSKPVTIHCANIGFETVKKEPFEVSQNEEVMNGKFRRGMREVLSAFPRNMKLPDPSAAPLPATVACPATFSGIDYLLHILIGS